MKKLWIGIGIAGVVALAIMLTLTRTKEELKEIKVGAICPLTGDAAVYGQWFKNGIDLALEEINSQGGIKNRKLIVIYEDSRADPKEGISAVQKLITVHNVSAIIGAMASSVTLAIAPIAEKNKVVLLSPASSAPKITYAGDYVFRNWSSDVFEGKIMVDFAYEKLDIKRVAVLYINNEYGVGIKDVFETYFRKRGGMVVNSESYEQGATDFRTQLTKIKSKQPEAIYLPTMAKEAGQILRQAQEIGVQAQFLSIMGVEAPIVLKVAGKAAEGVIYSYPGFDPESPSEIVQRFQAKYMAKYGEKAEAFAAHSYDALKIIASAIEKADCNADGIKNVLYEIKDFPGVTGQTTFDENGDVIKPVMIKVIKDGKFAPYPSAY